MLRLGRGIEPKPTDCEADANHPPIGYADLKFNLKKVDKNKYTRMVCKHKKQS